MGVAAPSPLTLTGLSNTSSGYELNVVSTPVCTNKLEYGYNQNIELLGKEMCPIVFLHSVNDGDNVTI